MQTPAFQIPVTPGLVVEPLATLLWKIDWRDDVHAFHTECPDSLIQLEHSLCQI